MQIANLISHLHSAICISSDALLSVVLSPACAACDQPLDHPDPRTCLRAPAGDRSCRSRRRSAIAAAIRCRPGAPSASRSRCCPALPARRRGSIDRARAIGAYDGALRAIVHALKYEGRRSLARPLGRLMRERGADLLDGAACAIPVPLHPSRRRAPRLQSGRRSRAAPAASRSSPRCAACAPRRRRPACPPAGVIATCATRSRSRARPRRSRGAIVVLIDDVSTTGATLDACARVLKEAGIAEVRALTAARVVGD